MQTLEAIEARIQKLRKQADAIERKQALGIVANIRALMDKHHLTIADIQAYEPVQRRGRKSMAKATVAVADAGHDGALAKYRDPKTGATWSGRGRKPAWIANAKNLAKYLIASVDGTTSNGTGKDARVKSVKPVKSKRRISPKYRDPKTGATWTGMGRAPAWIKDAKNRDTFLIA
ncbi:DNA-binding protein H-NS [Paraburkholderia caribensis MBA4]|uniref:DNA-binding protein H-NS n=1 Tax=Paraburkholderia caribensis MBA4 TaxID=1323664 RepID=A0A0P0RHP0_9BURK